MNLLEMLHEELSDKNWSTEEIARYLYIRSCEIFSYDPRYKFKNFLKDDCANSILNREIDLTNLEDNYVTCKSYAKFVLPKLMKELADIDVEVYGKIHFGNSFFMNNEKMDVDASGDCDIARVKMGLSTYGYAPFLPYQDFFEKLKRIDQKINYIKDDYQEIVINSYIKDNVSKQVLKDKLEAISNFLKQYSKIKYFSDAQFCIEYLWGKFSSEEEYENSEYIYLCQRDNYNSWLFYNINLAKSDNDTLFYLLKKNHNTCSFQEISYQDAKHLARHLEGINKSAILSKRKTS